MQRLDKRRHDEKDNQDRSNLAKTEQDNVLCPGVQLCDPALEEAEQNRIERHTSLDNTVQCTYARKILRILQKFFLLLWLTRIKPPLLSPTLLSSLGVLSWLIWFVGTRPDDTTQHRESCQILHRQNRTDQRRADCSELNLHELFFQCVSYLHSQEIHC